MAGNCVNCVDACFIRKIVGAYVAVQSTNRGGVSGSGHENTGALNAAATKAVAKIAEALCDGRRSFVRIGVQRPARDVVWRVGRLVGAGLPIAAVLTG